MNSDKRRQARQLHEVALKCPRAELSLFLDESCNGDGELRREVETLLFHSVEAESFPAKPVVGESAEVVSEEGEKSLIGQNLNHYKILKSLGKGGMGEVFLAEDTTLERLVLSGHQKFSFGFEISSVVIGQ